MDFGNRSKQLRKNAGMTQEQIAKRIGVTKSVISFYELRERAPSPEVLIKYAKIFHVSTDYLLGLEDNQQIDVTGLTPKQVVAVSSIIDALRKKN